MQSKELYDRLKTEVDNIQVVDAHEHHLLPEEDYLELGADFARLFLSYTVDDLIVAGMELQDRDEFRDTAGFILRDKGKVLSLEEKWRHIKPHWENIRYLGYSRAILHSLKMLCGVEDLNDDTYVEISEKIAGYKKQGVYRKILKEICGFKYILNDIDKMAAPGAYERMDRSLFHFVARFWHFMYAYQKMELEYLEEKFNRPIRNLDNLLDTLDEQFEIWKKEGIVALKCSDAYERDLFYEDATRDEAERVFRRTFTFNEQPSDAEARPFQNYITHRVLDSAVAYGLPVIFHTGIQAGTYNVVQNSNASHLVNLFVKYPKLKFHLYHANYPYMGEAASIAKQFPNVTLDLTWVHIIVPVGARQGLSHFIDMVPVNKIQGFGGDFRTPECVPGALEVARENITYVLADKVEINQMTEAQAVEVARKLLVENVQKIFNFEG